MLVLALGLKIKIHCIALVDVDENEIVLQTLPKAQRTQGLSLYHKITVHINLEHITISESLLSINFKISTKHQYLD